MCKTQEKSFMLKLFDYLTKPYNGAECGIKNVTLTTLQCVNNHYDTEELPCIPAGTTIVCDFGGDFGLYAVADIQGVLHKVKIKLNELHLIDWSPLRDKINRM